MATFDFARLNRSARLRRPGGGGDRGISGHRTGNRPRHFWPPAPTWWCAGAPHGTRSELPASTDAAGTVRPGGVRSADSAGPIRPSSLVDGHHRQPVREDRHPGQQRRRLAPGRRRRGLPPVFRVDRGPQPARPPLLRPGGQRRHAGPRAKAGRSSTSPRSAGSGRHREPRPTARPRPA